MPSPPPSDEPVGASAPAVGIDELIASAERIRSALVQRVEETRARVAEAEAAAGATPERLRALGGIVSGSGPGGSS